MVILKWLIAPALGGLGGAATLLVVLLGLAACQARVGGATLDDAEASILCGSSSNRLLPECKDFRPE